MKFPVIFPVKISNSYKEVLKFARRNHKISDNPYQMYCPYCGAPLVITDRMEQLETLDEHVSGSYVTKKHVYKCSTGISCPGNMAMWAYTHGETH